VLPTPEPVQLCGTDGRRVQVDARLQMSADPASVWWGDGTSQTDVVGWAGPWPVVQRWWAGSPRRAVYLQVTLAGGQPVLLALSEGVWTLEARYD